MELRQIRSFLSIAETLHFGRTAQLVHLSQPALSLQIRALEEELGVRLFERNRRTTSLTEAGVAFRDDAAAALGLLEEAARKARLAADGKTGLIRIGFISTAGAEILPPIMRAFRKLYPDVEFSLRNVLTADQTDMLEAGTLDIGFLRVPLDGHAGLTITPIHTEAFVLAVPAAHPFAAKKKVKLAETSAEDFLMYERKMAPGFHDLILAMLRGAGVVPRICQTAGEMPTLISLIDAGMGIAILPISAVRRTTASVVGCAIADDIPISQVGIAHRKGNLPKVVKNFVALTLQLRQQRDSLGLTAQTKVLTIRSES